MCIRDSVQETGQFAGEGCGRLVVKFARRVVGDAGLGGVGSQVTQVGVVGALQQCLVILIRIDAAGHRGDDALGVDLLAVFEAAQIQRVQALLLVDHFGQARGDGLAQHHFAVEAAFFVGHVKEIIHESAQEVALAELQHFFGRVLQQIAVITHLLQSFVRQFVHNCISP